MNNVDTLFLLGCMRSGTTLCRNVLGSHHNVLTLGSELNRFWTRAGVPAGIVPRNPPMGKDQARPELVDLVRTEFGERFRRRNFPISVAYRAYRKCRYGNETIIKSGKPFYLLNKSTQHLNKVPLLAEIFPKAFFVYIVRDIYSHACSMKKHLERVQRQKSVVIHYPAEPGCSWSFVPKSDASGCRGLNSYSFADIPRYWIEQNAEAVRAFLEMDPDRFLVIDFSDMVRRSELVLSTMRTRLNLRPADVEPSWRLINNLTSSPLDQWKDDLDPFDKTVVKEVMDRCQDQVNAISRFLEAHR